MKEYCKIENKLKEILEENSSSLFADYMLTREYLFNDIYPNIGKILPNYTYHDGSHVIQVLNNIFHLLGEEINAMPCEMLYFLCLSTLFHDVGLIYDRDDHQKKIGNVYLGSPGRIDIHKYGNERIIVEKIVEAHSGKAIDNTLDTLKYLGDQLGYSENINTQKVAAMLKFADELAEGGQRTSDYFIKNDMYEKNSKIFHIYSQSYKSLICKKDNRISINYNIGFSINNEGEYIIDQDITLNKFLEFIFDRLIKLDDERKYCRFYCSWLDSMKEISVKFNFWYDGELVEIGLDPILFSDKIIPGSSARKIETSFPNYSYNNILNNLKKEIEIRQGI